MIRVGVNGYGTIGKRVADAVATQPDMELIGVTKTRPNYGAEAAIRRGYDLYAASTDHADAFTDTALPLAGTLTDLLEAVDVIVDCCPAGIGETNRSTYAAHGVPAVFQGGERAELADASFTARSNFEAARGADAVRVVSCNTTGLARLLAPLAEAYGIERAHVTLIRRGGDPSETDRGPINDIVPDPAATPSHHGPDVNTVLPGVDVHTAAVKAPVTAMHTHSVSVTLEDTPTTRAVSERLAAEDRLFLIPEGVGLDGAGTLKTYAMDRGRPRGDLWENCIWAESLTASEGELSLFENVHQEADVVPENIDAIRAMCTDCDMNTSMQRTDDALGVGLTSLFETGDRRREPVAAGD